MHSGTNFGLLLAVSHQSSFSSQEAVNLELIEGAQVDPSPSDAIARQSDKCVIGRFRSFGREEVFYLIPIGIERCGNKCIGNDGLAHHHQWCIRIGGVLVPTRVQVTKETQPASDL